MEGEERKAIRSVDLGKICSSYPCLLYVVMLRLTEMIQVVSEGDERRESDPVGFWSDR